MVHASVRCGWVGGWVCVCVCVCVYESTRLCACAVDVIRGTTGSKPRVRGTALQAEYI